MNPLLTMIVAHTRAMRRACIERYGKEFDAPLPINQRLHARNHGPLLPRIAQWRERQRKRS